MALLLAAAVRHGDQLTTIDDLADLTRPEGILSGPRAPGASDAASAAMRLP